MSFNISDDVFKILRNLLNLYKDYIEKNIYYT